jgi:hypothetical protein
MDARFDPIVLQLKISDSMHDYHKLVMHMIEVERLLDAWDTQEADAQSERKGEKV